MWSPNMLAVGLADLAENLAYRERCVLGRRAPVRLARHLRKPRPGRVPCRGELHGSLHHRRGGGDRAQRPDELVLGAAAVADFEGDKIAALRAYFDDASLLEQMLEGAPLRRVCTPMNCRTLWRRTRRRIRTIWRSSRSAWPRPLSLRRSGRRAGFAVVERDDGLSRRRVRPAAIWGGGCQVHVVWVERAAPPSRSRPRAPVRGRAEARDGVAACVMGLTYDVLTGDYYDPRVPDGRGHRGLPRARPPAGTERTCDADVAERSACDPEIESVVQALHARFGDAVEPRGDRR